MQESQTCGISSAGKDLPKHRVQALRRGGVTFPSLLPQSQGLKDQGQGACSICFQPKANPSVHHGSTAGKEMSSQACSHQHCWHLLHVGICSTLASALWQVGLGDDPALGCHALGGHCPTCSGAPLTPSLKPWLHLLSQHHPGGLHAPPSLSCWLCCPAQQREASGRELLPFHTLSLCLCYTSPQGWLGQFRSILSPTRSCRSFFISSC